MKLLELLKDMPYVIETRGDLETEIGGITNNSREKTDGAVFSCVSGTKFDSHDFAAQAVENGCRALLVERFLDGIDVPQVRVSNSRAALSRAAAAYYGWPARQLRMVGITGTKGKTTTSYMVKFICEQAGFKCGLIGTTGNMIGEKRMPSKLTTPDPIELQRTLRMMADEGVQIVIMEVSAHAIDMCRLDGVALEAGCYTNLSQDHLDYFGTMQNYFEAKKKMFVDGSVLNAALNVDDDMADEIERDLTIPHLRFGISQPADLYARDIEITENGVNFVMQLHDAQAIQINLIMTGMFNVYNALAASACALILGVSLEDIKTGLESIRSVPGRIEMLPTGTPYKVILDYSHTPDSLRNILETVRTFTRRRLIALFGCGGDRDKGKRPIMGEIGGELADLCILTSDNPRTEDPMAILAAVEEGARRSGKPYVVIENRRDAIRHALEIGEDGDVIVLAGKGHETYQEIMGVKRPFDEKVVVAELLDELRGE